MSSMALTGMTEDSVIQGDTADMLKYTAIRLLTVLLPFIPYYITDMIAKAAGILMYSAGNWRIQAVRGNMENLGIEVYDERSVFVNQTASLLDFLRMYYLGFNRIRHITMEPDIADMLKERPILLVSAHYGCWELAGLYISHIFGQMFTVAESAGPGMKEYRIYEKLRSVTGMKILRLEDKELGRNMDNLISSGYSPVLMTDRDYTHTGVKTRMGLADLSMPKGPYFFAKKYGLPLYFGLLYRVKHKRFRYKADIRRIGNCSDIRHGAQQVADDLFSIISSRPEYWYAYEAYWGEK